MALQVYWTGGRCDTGCRGFFHSAGGAFRFAREWQGRTIGADAALIFKMIIPWIVRIEKFNHKLHNR
jgi:hypothetical protein